MAILLGLTLALGAGCLWLGRELMSTRQAAPNRHDGEVVQSAAATLADSIGALYDSHPDPLVGRILAADQENAGDDDALVTTNAYGIRERPYELPKPPGTLRIVLLGDSYVFGWKVRAEERMGAVLERYLSERIPAGGPKVECLHLGVASWNLVAECTYLRRQLDRLRPDLVFHFTVSNDIDDVTGVRGFGVPAAFSVAHRERADGFISQNHPSQGLGISTANLLPFGLDGESRERFDEAGEEIRRLTEDLERLTQPAKHVLIANWGLMLPVFHERLGAALDAGRRFYVPRHFWSDSANVLSESDYHWSPHGHERIARMLYGLILERDLLPDLGLAAWPEVAEEARRMGDEGIADAQAGLPPTFLRAFEMVDRAVDFRTLDMNHAVQVYGGIDAEGLVSPYAVLMLRADGARTLDLEGLCLPDRVLDGTVVQVQLDGIDVASFSLEPNKSFTVQATVPAELADRRFLALRLQTSNYVYRGLGLRHCVGWQLLRAELSQ